MKAPPLAEINRTDTVRLIPTAYFKPPVLRPLVDTDEEADVLAQIEGLTSRRLKAETSGLSDLDAREMRDALDVGEGQGHGVGARERRRGGSRGSTSSSRCRTRAARGA